MNEYGVIYNALAAHRQDTNRWGLLRCTCGKLCAFESTWREHLTELILERLHE